MGTKPLVEQQSRQFGEFVIDPAHNTITSDTGARQVPARVMDVLLHLIEHQDRVVSTEELLATFWGDRVVEESTVHRVVSQIRSALGDSAREPRFIRTVSKRGYQAIAAVSSVPAPSEIPSEAPVEPPGIADAAAAGPLMVRFRWMVFAAGILAIAVIVAVTLTPSDRSREDIPAGGEFDASPQLDIDALNSVATLPFINLSDDPELGFFAVGLADTILDELVKQDLRVAARTSAFQAADNITNLAATARALNVSYLIEGSVQLRDDTVRVTSQLIRASDGHHVWSKTYDEPRTESFDTQSLIAANAARLVGTMIRSDTMKQHPELFDHLSGREPKAIEYYLEAQKQYELFALGEGGDWDYSVQLMRNAAAEDPNFAAAHREIAWANMQRLGGRLPLADASREAHDAIEKALALEPDSSDTLLQLAQIYLNLDLDYVNAESVIRRGIELYPQGRWWYPLLADIALREGRSIDSLRFMDTASAIDFGEEQVTFLQMRALQLIAAGDFEAALEITDEALQLVARGDQRAAVLRMQATALIQLGQTDRARSRIEEAWKIAGSKQPENFAQLFAATGQLDRARTLLSEVAVRPGNAWSAALGHLHLGEIDRTFEWLEYGIDEHEPAIVGTLRTGSFWDEVREDPRFPELIQRLEAKEIRTSH